MPRATLVPLVLLAAIVVAPACDSPTTPRASAGVAAVTPLRLTGIVRKEVTPAPTVVVTDGRGRPLAGVVVRFDAAEGSGSVMRPAVLTDSAGRATSGWILGQVAGIDHLLVASIEARPPVVFVAAAVPDTLAQIVANGGDFQSGLPGSTLPMPLSASAVDSFGNSIPAVTFAFEVVSGGGSLEATTAVADASGIATAGRWTLGPSLGEQRVRATVAGRDVTFTAFGCSAEQGAVTCDGPPQLAFVNFTDRQIYTMLMDGGGLRRLTNEGLNMRPSWSPDGRRIAFARANADVADVYLMDADGSRVVRRTLGAGFLSAAWSPDGRKLAVSSEGIYDGDIWVIPADDDGSPAVHLMNAARSPAWSPDGTRIAYVRLSGDDGYHGLRIVNANGTGDREIFFTTGGIPGRPSWSPDGKRLAFGKCEGGSCDLFSLNTDGTGVRRLTQIGSVQEAAWAPRGDWIAVSLWNYAVIRNVSVTLAYVPADGGSAHPGASGGMHPAWRPLAPVP